MSKAATMEIPINSNGDSRNLAEDDSLEQVSDAWCDFNSFNSDFNVKKCSSLPEPTLMIQFSSVCKAASKCWSQRAIYC